MTDFTDRLERKLSSLEHLGLKRTLPGGVEGTGRIINRDGEEFLNCSSNDYLALARDDEVCERSIEALETHGLGSGGSRLICGDHPLYRQFEQELADWKGRESALVFGSGYLTSLGVIRALVGGRDLVLYDEWAHRCLIEGGRLSDADVEQFHHNDVENLETILAEGRADYDAVLVLTEGVFSMDGDRAPLGDIKTVCDRHDAWMLVDEAHSAGVWGPHGAGLTPKLDSPVEVAMGTLSKAFGAYGGYVTGPSQLKSFLVNRATSLIYSTGLPPSVVAGSLAGLRVIRRDEARRSCLKGVVDELVGWMSDREIPLPEPASQVIPVMTGSVQQTVKAGEVLRDCGIYAVPIRYPTVPRTLGRVRLSLRSDFDSDDVQSLTTALEALDNRDLIERVDPW